MGIEPTTCSLGSYRSATELRPRLLDASGRLGARPGRRLFQLNYPNQLSFRRKPESRLPKITRIQSPGPVFVGMSEIESIFLG